MSGLEIVGVVLGSIPLATAALGQYADGVSTIKAMVKYENVFLDLQVQLMVSMSLFRQTCELLLRGLALPDAQFRDLVEHNIGWESSDLAEALRRRLGNEDFGTFHKALQRVQKRLALMARKLRLQDDLTPPFMQDNVADEERRKEFFASWRYRIAGGFNAAKHQRNCAEIYSDVRQLHDLIHGALSLESDRHGRFPLS
ncbi:hypothetical protein DIS24_g7785 [Lasiodiplodia hormozganensis]|uniref:Fungal N-terminal domain-containing protein n=2 Tax=Lasiodiplodia TaxID=66739 RepID=A0AA39Y7D4_9PEZI|nr:hypothetical protein DIS24_g7785 [Lasiodiplodia hormozganensis]